MILNAKSRKGYLLLVQPNFWRILMHLSATRLLLVLLFTAFAQMKLAAADEISVQKLTTETFKNKVQRELMPGMNREDAEAVLKSLGIEWRFIPRAEFSLNSSTSTIMAPPEHSVGVLSGTRTGFEKTGIFEPFVIVVAFIGSDGKISKVASKVLTSGP